MKYKHWYSLDGNQQTTKLWGNPLPITTKTNLPSTLFEVHGLELEQSRSVITRRNEAASIIENLKANPSSGILIMAASEYTRAFEGVYAQAYRDLVKRGGVKPKQICVLVCSESLAATGRELYPDIVWAVYDYWEHQPRLWFGEWHCENALPEPNKRFVCLNRRPHEIRAALYTDLMRSRAYRYNTWHTIGNRNYHNPDHADMDLGVIRSGGYDPINYLDRDIEDSAAVFYKNPYVKTVPGNPTSFQDRRLFEISARGTVNIVTESYPNQTQHSPTEKTYRAYAVARPHITFAHPRWESKNLVPRGYHLYPWDEDLDACRDPAKRYRLARNLILDWAEMDDQQFEEIMRVPLQIAQQNHQLWLNRTENTSVCLQLPESLIP